MTPDKYKTLRKEIACFMRRLYKRGLTTASGGNISIRIDDGILITPSAIDKGSIKGKQIGLVSFEGKNLTPELKPSMETGMHLAIFKSRSDINVIVHAHPPFATCFTAMESEIDCSLIAEARALLGVPCRAEYALMGTGELAKIVADTACLPQNNMSSISKNDPQIFPNVILMQNHGIVCLGKDILTAFDRMEVLESAAKMTIITSLLNNKKQLSLEQLKEIDNLMNC